MAPADPQHEDPSLRIAAFTKRLAKDPASKAFLPLAEEYAKIGRFREAVAVLKEGLKAYPTFILARTALGRVYYQAGQRAEAKATLQEAIKDSPENLLAHRTLARIYLDENALDDASRSCAVLLAANPKDPDALGLKAAIEQRQQGAGGRAGVVAVPALTPIERAVVPARQDAAQASSGAAANDDARARKVARLKAWLATVQRRRESERSRSEVDGASAL
ncbi:tetratricopeptide repeat protein [Nitrospira sp. Kam-Ns4a]